MGMSTDPFDSLSDDEIRARIMGVQPALAAGEPNEDELRALIRGPRDPVELGATPAGQPAAQDPSSGRESGYLDMSTTPPTFVYLGDSRISAQHAVPPFAVGAVKGFSDLGNTLLNAAGAPVTFASEKLGPGNLLEGAASGITANRERREQANRDYEAEFGGSGQALAGRITGDVAATLPFLLGGGRALAPYVGGPLKALAQSGRLGKLTNLMLTGAGAGGAGAALLSGGTDTPFAEQGWVGMASGALLNPLLTPLIGGTVGAAKWGAGKVNKLMSGGAQQAAGPRVAPTVAPMTAGTPVGAPGAAVAAPAAPVAAPAATATTGALSADQAARKANMEAFGIKPTTAMVTRNELDWAAENEAAKHSQDLMVRARENSDAMRNALNKAQESFGGSSQGAFDAGEGLLDFVKIKDKQLQQAVTAAYTKVRQELGDQGAIGLDKLVGQKAPLAVETEGKPIAQALDGWLKHIKAVDDDGNALRKLTVKEAEEVRKFIGRQGAETDAADRVRRMLTEALDDDVTAAMGKDPFEQARMFHAERKGAVEASKVLRQVSDRQFRPGDDFVERHIVAKGVKPEDVSKLMEYLQTGTPEQVAAGQEVLADLRRETARWIATGSVKGGSSEQGVVSYPFLKKRLQAIGPQKLRTLFGDDVADYYRRLLQAAHDVEVEPPKSPLNRSNTAAQLKKDAGKTADRIDTAANVLGLATGHPYIGGAVSLTAKGARALGERSARKSQERMVENALMARPHQGEPGAELNPLLRPVPGSLAGATPPARSPEHRR